MRSICLLMHNYERKFMERRLDLDNRQIQYEELSQKICDISCKKHEASARLVINQTIGGKIHYTIAGCCKNLLAKASKAAHELHPDKR